MEHDDVFPYAEGPSEVFIEVVPQQLYLDVCEHHVNMAVISPVIDNINGRDIAWVTLDSQFAAGVDKRSIEQLVALRDAIDYVIKEHRGENYTRP